MRDVDWYFDFISPYSYLCFHRMPRNANVRLRPVLFAGLLNHFGHKGPAEIPAKRLWTYRSCVWLAKKQGVPFRFPALHPFNSLHHLRLCLAAGNTDKVVRTIFDDIWTTGADATDPARFKALCQKLGVTEAQLGEPSVKDALRKNSEDAIAASVFGVPSFVADGEVFWGADSVDFLDAFLSDPTVLRNDEMKRAANVPVGAARQPSIPVATLKAITDAFNAHDLDAIMGFFAEDCSLDMPRGPDPWGKRFTGKAAVREGLATRFNGLPDVHYGDDRHWVSGNLGVSEWLLTGTTPDGVRLKVRGCDHWEFRDGKVVRKDSYWKIVER